MKGLHFRLLLTTAILLNLLSWGEALSQGELDYELPNGHFYKQGNGAGGAGEAGFSVTDDEVAPFWSEFRRLGGPQRLGYPISRRFLWRGFLSQVTQRAVLQWRPDLGRVELANLLDEFSRAGLDNWLKVAHEVPVPITLDETGKSWEEIVQGRLSLLDSNPAIRAYYYSFPDPQGLHGLPASRIQDFGHVYVLRAQRSVIQLWKEDLPWAKKGELTLANAGELGKEAGLFASEALIPEGTPSAPPPPTAPAFLYEPYGQVLWSSNCGLTEVKIYLRDANENPLDGVRFRIEPVDGGWRADSYPTGYINYSGGRTDFALSDHPVAATWRLWVIDGAGNRLSPTQEFTTDSKECGEGTSGHQIASVFWKANFVQPANDGWTVLAPEGHYQYTPWSGVSWAGNCGLTQAKIYLKDAQGNPVNNVHFRIEPVDGGWSATSYPTGFETYEPGWTDFMLRTTAFRATWNLWALDVQGNRASPIFQFKTDAAGCEEDGRPGHHQIATIFWTMNF